MNGSSKWANEMPLYDCIAGAQLAREVERRGEHFVPAEDGILFREGGEADAVYFLKRGECRLTMLTGDKEVISLRVLAGSLLGLPAVMGNKPYSLTASIVGPAEIYRIGRNDFQEILQRDARLCLDALGILAAAVHSARIALGELLRQRESKGQ